MARVAALSLVLAALFLQNVTAQFGGGYDGGGGGYHGGKGNSGCYWGGDCSGSGSSGSGSSGSSGSSSAQATNGYGFGLSTYRTMNSVLIAHAVIASLVWVILIPSFALLLRLNISSPWILRLHAIGQVLSYIAFIAAAGLGIWLAKKDSAYTNVWGEAHPIIGLVILAVAFFQPIFGFVHHRIFKSRQAAVSDGHSEKQPGRTPVGLVHLWVGRALILLAMVNGGLGIQLAGRSPFQTDATTRKASIAYGVVAGLMGLLYIALVVSFEMRRKRAQRNALMPPGKERLPTYLESTQSQSESSVEREPSPERPPIPRYG